MTGVHSRHGLVILVVVAVGMSVAAPAAASPHDGDLGGGLDGPSDDTTSSDGDLLSDDSGATSDGSADPETGDDGLLSGDTGSTDGKTDTTAVDPGAGDGPLTDDEPPSTADGAPADGAVTALVERVDGMRGVDIGTVRTSEVLDEGISEPDLVDVDEAGGNGDGTATRYEIELVELPSTTAPLVAVRAPGDTTERTTATVASLSRPYDTVAGDLVGGPDGVTDISTGPAASPPEPAVEGPAAVEPPDGGPSGGEEGERVAQPSRQSALGVHVPTGELPGGPVWSGAALGGLGLAAAAIARQAGTFGGLSAGLADATGTAATAVPGSSRSGRLVRLLAPLRYSRYDASDPLEHETRDAMLEVIEESPGIYLSAVADRVEVPPSTARHHVRVLEREDLVSGAKVRGKRRFYPAHTEAVELDAAMSDDATAAIVDALARVGTASVSDLADELGKDPSTVTHHVQRLEADGVVVRERDGRAVMNRLSAAVRTALEPAEPTAEEPPAGEAMASD